MTAVLYAVVYVALLAFGIGTAARAVRYARAPMHLRWELYPVPHEPTQRLKHGGSYYEVADWWTEPRSPNLVAEIWWMAREILFLKGLWDENRPLWLRSFPFHFGLYLLAGSAGLFVLAALGGLAFSAEGMAGGAGALLGTVARVAGTAGFVLALAGAVGLLHRRLTDPALRPSTTPGDISNLLFFVVAFGLLAGGLAAAGSPGVAALAAGLLTFDTALRVPPLLAAGVVATALLVVYIPLTHMSHYVAKYFTYHAVRWDDQPLRASRAAQAKLAEYLTFRPTWAAAHVKGDGKKTWADIVTTNPTEGARK